MRNLGHFHTRRSREVNDVFGLGTSSEIKEIFKLRRSTETKDILILEGQEKLMTL